MSKEEVRIFVEKFKGMCNKCGKFGHKGADCRTNDVKGTESMDRSTGLFKGKWYYCGQSGHKKANCNKRKQKQEMAVVACSEHERESSNESFDELGFVTGWEGIAQPSEKSWKHVSFYESVQIKEYSP